MQTRHPGAAAFRSSVAAFQLSALSSALGIARFRSCLLAFKAVGLALLVTIPVAEGKGKRETDEEIDGCGDDVAHFYEDFAIKRTNGESIAMTKNATIKPRAFFPSSIGPARQPSQNVAIIGTVVR